LRNHAAQWERDENSGDVGLMNARFQFNRQDRNNRMQRDTDTAGICINRLRLMRCGSRIGVLPFASFCFRNINVPLCRCELRRLSAAVSVAIRLAAKQVFEKLKHVQSSNRSSALSGPLS
jgi:hypothetical protein